MNKTLKGRLFENTSRSHAVEVLGRILEREDDVVIRSQAVECFEQDDVALLCEKGRKIAAWWKLSKAKARSRGIVFSDDEVMILAMYKDLCADAGWKKVFVSTHAEETLRLAEEVQPALVVTDLKKPGMSGEEMAEVLKSKPSTSSIPILLASACSTMEIEGLRCQNLFCGLLRKPFKHEEFLHTVEMAIAGKYADS